MKNNKYWFSFIELIVVISIISLISIIWLSINNNYTEKTNNSKATSDIQTIKNALESYRNDSKTLANPMWNKKYFDDSSNYVHYDNPIAFWVYWNITQHTIPNKYLNYIPIDPRTNQYYAYGRTLNFPLNFEISWINKIDWIYEAKVVWDYIWNSWPYNLIREYNWPQFIYDKSKTNFPYNPYEKLINAKIWSFSGVIKVNNIVIDKNWILNNQLISWDKIFVATWAESQIYFADWSKSTLWDLNFSSEIVLTNMYYKDTNNLFTKIQLALNFWSLTTFSSKLDQKSEFEVYTIDAEAVVRWTIFNINRFDQNQTNITLQTWSLFVNKLVPVTNFNDLVSNLYNSNPISKLALGANSVWIPLWATFNSIAWEIVLTSNWNLIETIIDHTTFQSVANWLASLNTPFIANDDWLQNIKVKLISMWSWIVKIWLPTSFSWTNKLVFSWSTDITWFSSWNKNILTISWLANSVYSIIICNPDKILCTRPLDFNLISWTNYENNDVIRDLWLCDDFWQFWCVAKDESLSWYTLVSYAPYDKIWDIDMYKKDWQILNKETDWILLNWGDDSDTTIPWVNSWDHYNKNSSFYNKDWVKWIVIWEGWPITDYLKYDISSLWLWNEFAVEIWVRWIWKNYFSTSGGVNDYLLKYAFPKLYFIENGLTYLKREMDSLWLDNKIYSIIARNWNLKIVWTNFNETTFVPLSWNLWNFLFVWTRNDKINPFENVIDYVKIYKK
jgi:prepilin-type N-terminal cleavage/methylation domain-containing protein